MNGKLFARLLGMLICPALAVAQSDFTYNVNPPRMQVTSGVPAAAAIGPFCGTFQGLPLVCYSPSFLRSAYNYPSTLDGTGQTIVIVDAFGSPTIAQDLEVFDHTFGIPAPPSFTVVCPQGCPAFNSLSGNQVGWTFETTLDVEYAHAMAPGARIVLVVATSNFGSALNNAIQAAIPVYPGSVMSQSFGVPESAVSANNAQILQAEALYADAQAAGITVLASTGDFGATNGGTTVSPQFPASDPLVLAIGGTEGNPYPSGLASCHKNTCTGMYGGEQVWNEPVFGAATGGAPSLLFGVPAFQSGLGLTARTTPDVSYNASVNGGVLVYWSAVPSQAGFYIFGGTSASSPQWAAILALANQLAGRPLGYLNPTIYRLAESSAYSTVFHDITVGNNQLVGTPAGFSAGAGWDDASGWGTPNVANLLPELVKCATGRSCP